jgi:hypothetical protein
MDYNGSSIAEGQELELQTFNLALKMNRIIKFQITTAACLLAILCYGLPFHDNALGGLVKPTIIVMAKSQNGGGQPPKKEQLRQTFVKQAEMTRNSRNSGKSLDKIRQTDTWKKEEAKKIALQNKLRGKK